MYWDKFGYPEWMLSRYVGEMWSIFSYWWIDTEKQQGLESAMETGESLPILPIDMKYWPDYLKKNK